MPLSTTNLTLHCDASDTDNVFTTYVGTGIHTGVPGDGVAVQVWDDEDDGIADVAWMWDSGSSSEPDYSSAAFDMLFPNLLFNGSSHYMKTWNQVGNTPKQAGSFISAAAWSALFAIHPEVISTTASDPWDNHNVINDGGDLWGIMLKDVGGNKKAIIYQWDGAAKVVTLDLPGGANTSYVIYGKYDGSTLSGSVDGGTPVTTSTVGNISGALTNAMKLGVDFSNLGWYNGRMGEHAIWNIALSGSAETDSISYMTTKWITGAVAGHPAGRRFGLTNSGLWVPRHRPIEIGRQGTMVI